MSKELVEKIIEYLKKIEKNEVSPIDSKKKKTTLNSKKRVWKIRTRTKGLSRIKSGNEQRGTDITFGGN